MKRIYLHNCLIAAVLLGTGWQNGISATTLPSAHQEGGVTWLSGGVGEDESQAIRQVMAGYPLVIEFLGKTQYGNEYLANIPIRISDTHGKVILDTQSDGPFMLAKLPPGKYTATASYNGKVENRTFNLTQKGNSRVIFQWKMQGED